MLYSIRLEKEDFKFSCSHFTVWGPNSAERLHGHNYYASIRLDVDELDPQLGLAFDFNSVKSIMRELTSTLDEYVLLPKNSPFVKIEVLKEQIQASLGRKVYVFPAEDVLLLECSNVTSEELARFLAERVHQRLMAVPQVAARTRSIEVGVEETRGQKVSYQLAFGNSVSSRS
jgi:6-pyruvoyltetrahydropterin/6-carboxytetrahydropterin synthase